MQILYIGSQVTKTISGADVINKRNQKLLENILGPDNVHYIPISPKGGIRNKFYMGITKNILYKIKYYLEQNDITHIFLSQSLLGRVALYVKKNFPKIKIVTFFHNIELDYAKSYLRDRGYRAYPFYIRAKSLEKQAVLNSDILITLNARDSKRLHEVYNKKSDIELPTSFDDNYNENKCHDIVATSGLTIDFLFVGVAFFANIQGIQWFIDKIMPKISGDLYIIGKGMDQIKFKNVSDRVHILGFVEDLSEFYYRAKTVVSPILSGAGMKTKTAEALMYGRTIIGTDEAFEGYDIDNKCMILANTEESFIKSINSLSYSGLNSLSRKLFLDKYETKGLEEKLKQIIC